MVYKIVWFNKVKNKEVMLCSFEDKEDAEYVQSKVREEYPNEKIIIK